MRTTAIQQRSARLIPRGLPALILGVLTLLAFTPASRSAELTVGTASGLVGDTVIVPVTVDDLTGLGVVSYELTITWSSAYATALGALHLGTMSEGWGPLTFSSGEGWLTVAAAGVIPLSGGGTLFELQFQLGPSSGTHNLILAEALLNEGTPPVTAMTNGSLSITAPPTINVSPDTGEIAVGESIAFSSSGGTAPYTYTSSDPAIANLAGNLLFGLSPGAVSVTSEDDAGITGSTTGVIDVRAVKLSVAAAAGTAGNFVWVHINVSNTVPYDITSFSFGVTYNASRMTAMTVDISSTLLAAANWATPEFHVSQGRVDVAASGVTALGGSGALLNLLFHIEESAPNSTNTLTPVDGIFKEIYPAWHASGTLTITGLPNLTISPDQPELVAGDVQDFIVSGASTPPLAWGLTNPAVGSIDASGSFTALAGGETRVFVVDSVGATDTTSSFRVCNFYLYAPSDTIYTIPTTLPLSPDRDLSGLGIYGYELTLEFDETRIEYMGVSTTGTSSQPWGSPIANPLPGKSILVNAGPEPLTGSLPLLYMTFRALPALYGTSSALSITKALFNEGTPCARVINGTLQLPTAAPDISSRKIVLIQNYPNPFNPSTRIEYSLPEPTKVTLCVYDVGGALVAELVEAWHPRAGKYSVLWDGKDGLGKSVPSGVYFYRLRAAGVDLTEKMVLLR